MSPSKFPDWSDEIHDSTLKMYDDFLDCLRQRYEKKGAVAPLLEAMQQSRAREVIRRRSFQESDDDWIEVPRWLFDALAREWQTALVETKARRAKKERPGRPKRGRFDDEAARLQDKLCQLYVELAKMDGYPKSRISMGSTAYKIAAQRLRGETEWDVAPRTMENAYRRATKK